MISFPSVILYYKYCIKIRNFIIFALKLGNVKLFSASVTYDGVEVEVNKF